MDLRKAYSEDPRIPCHYGRKCYQKNPNHHTKYKHPPDPKRKNQYITDNSAKRQKLNAEDVDKKLNAKNEDMKKENLPNSSDSNDDSSKKPEVFSNDVLNSDSDGDDDQKLDSKHQEQKEKIYAAENGDSTQKPKVFTNDVSDSDSGNESADIIVSKNQNSVQESTLSTSHNVGKVKNETETVTTSVSHKAPPNKESAREYIKSKFLFDMPDDFYKFFDLCQRLNPKDPSKALASIDLTLIGPFDVLCGKFVDVERNSEDYLIHWRYYYDPPNLQTILKGNDRTGYHIGYFRDKPDDNPVFLTENFGLKDGKLTSIGENVFGAVSCYIEDKIKTCDPFSKMKFVKIQNAVKEEAEKLGYNLSRKTSAMTKRNNKVLSRTFNKIGLVVPYERKTQLGYRKLAMSEKDLEALLTKIDKAEPEKKPEYLAELQSEILTWTDIACDECDFGTGIELGWDILCHGVDLNHTISRLLVSNYRQLKWESFAKIAEAHMANRKKGCNLSIL